MNKGIQAAILGTLAGHPEGLTAVEIAQRVQVVETGARNNAIHTAISRLKQADKISPIYRGYQNTLYVMKQHRKVPPTTLAEHMNLWDVTASARLREECEQVAEG